MSWELLIPIRKRVPLYVVGQREVPMELRGRVAGAFGTGALPIAEIGHLFGGRSAQPKKPILLFGPDNRVLTFVIGDGEAEAAELEDLAYQASERNEQRTKQEWLRQHREHRGLPPAEKAPALISEALAEYGRDRLKNPSKYPRRQPRDRSWIRKLPEIPVP